VVSLVLTPLKLPSTLFQRIISLCGLEDELNERKTPAKTILHADLEGPDREHS
jgi:hypothetical protein